MKRPILVSLAAVILSLGLLGVTSPSAQAASSHAPVAGTAAHLDPANGDLPDVVDVVVVLVDRLTDVLFHHHDRDSDDDDHDRYDRDHDGDRDHSSRCRGVISVCLG